jgi:hypothetical protein
MALESQGIQIRRISTAAASTGLTANSLTISLTGAKQIIRGDAGSFVTDGFATAMRIAIAGSSNNTGIYTLSSVAATAMAVYETLVAMSSGTTVSVEGHLFTPIGDITGFSGPAGAAVVIDVTNLDSQGKEKIVGIRDEGNLTINVNLNNSADKYQVALIGDRASRSKRTFDIKLNDITTVAASQPSALNFDGYVTGFSVSGSVDNVVKGNITIELTSAVHWIAQV